MTMVDVIDLLFQALKIITELMLQSIPAVPMPHSLWANPQALAFLKKIG